MTDRILALYLRMIDFDAGEPRLIQHFTKVHAYAALIAGSEGLDRPAAEVLEAAALVHDIAIPLCESKYGSHTGPQQEKEGPALARAMLADLPFSEAETDRVCRLVGEHHTLSPVDGPDHQILLDADFLVNCFEHGDNPEANAVTLDKVFRTGTGRRIFAAMFGIREGEAGA